MKKIICLVVLIICLAGCSFGGNGHSDKEYEMVTQGSEGLEYTLLKDNTYAVSGVGTCSEKVIIIPSIYQGVPVTEIQSSAFKDCDNIETVMVSHGIKTILLNVFANCSMLKTVVIPQSVENIWLSAFSKCYALENVYYNGEIRDWLNIGFENSVSNPLSFATNLYLLDDDGTEEFNNKKYEKLTDLVVPEGVVQVKPYAFYGYDELNSITLPKSLKEISEQQPFAGCKKNLKAIKINSWNPTYDSRDNCNAIIESKTDTLIYGINTSTIPKSVEIIGEQAFADCDNLTSIVIPKKVNTIETSAFANCRYLVEIYNLSSLSLKINSTNHGSIALNAKVIHTSLNEKTSITSQDDFKFITAKEATYLFKYIGSNEEITLPQGEYVVNQYAFMNNEKIKEVIIPEGVTAVGDNAFDGCHNLTSIRISSTVVDFGVNCFYWCNNLENIIVDENNPIYDSRDNCNAVIFKQYNLLVIGCKGTVIPESVSTIVDFSFPGSTDLEGIIIPKTVNSISSYAFFQCNSLKDIYYGGSEAEWENFTTSFIEELPLEVTVYFYSENEPNEEGNYWHYNENNVVVIWQ